MAWYRMEGYDTPCYYAPTSLSTDTRVYKRLRSESGQGKFGFCINTYKRATEASSFAPAAENVVEERTNPGSRQNKRIIPSS